MESNNGTVRTYKKLIDIDFIFDFLWYRLRILTEWGKMKQ